MINVGIYGQSYCHEKLINNKCEHCNYTSVSNRIRLYEKTLRHLGNHFPSLCLSEVYAQGVHFNLYPSKHEKVDIIHTYNRVVNSKVYPWIASFEKTLPEYFTDEFSINKGFMKRHIEYILDKSCRAILPMSKWAYNYELNHVSQFATNSQVELVKNKMKVMYPPQKRIATDESIIRKFEDLDEKAKIKFLYVGRQLKRKGGVEIIRTFHELANEFNNFHVYLIGDLDDGYNNWEISSKDKNELKRIIEESKWLTYYKQMDNSDVMKLCGECHVGILPTMGDTFGFSVLEMQANGCPVITTNREALSEINEEDRGWILDTNSIQLKHGDDYGNYSCDEIDCLSKVVRKELGKTLAGLLVDNSSIKTKAIAAANYVERMHTPDEYGRQLRELYGYKD